MPRIGLKLRVRPDRLDEYNAIHATVWPELLQALRAAGLRNYSLFQRADGEQFGYLECDDWEAACAYLDQHPVHLKWQEWMRDFLIVPENAEGSQPVEILREVFHLD